MMRILLIILIIQGQIYFAHGSEPLLDSSYFPMRNGLEYIYKNGKQIVERKFTELDTNGWFLLTITYATHDSITDVVCDTLHMINNDVFRLKENVEDELYVPGEIQVGLRFECFGIKYEITQPISSMKVNGNLYFDIMVIESIDEGPKIRLYFAKGVGLIKGTVSNQSNQILVKIRE